MKKVFLKLKSLATKSPISIHPAFVFVFIICTIWGKTQIIITTTMLAILHEAGHALVAARYGYHLKKIRLMPFGAELCGDEYFLSSHETKIETEGQLVNLCICVFCVALMWINPNHYVWYKNVLLCSLQLALFNMLPFYPLDGGRIFVAIISQRVGRKTAIKIASILTILFGVFLCILCALSLLFGFNISLGLAGVLLICVGLFPSKDAKYERFTQKSFKNRKLKTGLLQKMVAISSDALFIAAYSNVDARTQTVFVVEDKEGNPIATLSEEEVDSAVSSGYAYKKISEYFAENH